MATHKLDRGGSMRLGPQPGNPQRNLSSRLPARTPTLSSISSIPTSPPTKLVKRKAVSSKGNEQLPQITRLPSKSGVRRVAGDELRRELAPPRGLPTLAHTTSQSQKKQTGKMKAQTTSRIASIEPTRTPSLVSGSSASTMDSPNSTLLRRKPSNIGKSDLRSSPDSLSSHEEGLILEYKDPYPNAVLGISMPPPSSTYQRVAAEDVINLDKYVLMNPPNLAFVELPPPSQAYALSNTPSTGYSPGPFSISSTPTSMSSVSPGILVSSNSKYGPRVTQPSPTRSRPPVVWSGTNEKTVDSLGLAPVRESSSSSASTIRGSDGGKHKDKIRFSQLPAPPPSPPVGRPLVSTHMRRKSGSNSSMTRFLDSKQRPPELAHLMEASPKKDCLNPKPVRPSRENTPLDLNLRDMSPIIQSNMRSLPVTSHKRQSSSESKRGPTSGLTVDTKYRFGLPRTRGPSPSPSQSSVLSPLSSRPPTRGTTPEVPQDAQKLQRTKPSPSLESKPLSRFGFFSRRNKPEPGAAASAKEKATKKGPVAGTGHEGYGKFAFRGRSGSTTSGSGSTSVGRSPSTDSAIGTTNPPSRKSSIGSKTGSEVDDFLVERLNPITLRGTGSAQPALERSQSEGSQDSLGQHAATRDSGLVASKSGSANSHQTSKRPVLLPSPMSDTLLSGTPVKRPSTSQSKKDQNEEKSRFGLSSLSTRRASRRSFLGGKSLANLADSQTSLTSLSSSMGGAISRQYTAPTTASGSMLSPDVSEDKDENRRRLARADTQPKAQLKPPKRWNFFQRARSPARKDSPAPEGPAVLVARQPPLRAVAHYAMMDRPPTIDADELERIMQEAESAPEPTPEVDIEDVPLRRSKSTRHGNSVLLPEPPTFLPEFAGPARPASPKVALNPRMPSPEPADPLAILKQPSAEPPRLPRPSRLAQVGRIPRVVSKRDRERKLSDASFSRPFIPNQPSPALKNGAFSHEQVVANPELVKAKTSDGSSSLSPPVSYREQEASSGSEPQSIYTGSGEFFTFPPRKTSELSNGSSSSGILNLTATTAVQPQSDAPPMEDEVWNEYDDLLDLLSTKTPKTPKTPLTGSSLGAPFQYSGFDAQSPTPGSVGQRLNEEKRADLAEPTVSSFAQRIRLPSLYDTRHLSPIPSLGTPTSAFRMSDFISSYERGLNVVDPVSGRLSLPSTGRLSSSTARLSLPPTMSQSLTPTPSKLSIPLKRQSSPTPAVNKRRDSRAIELAEAEHMGFETMANLRFGALMTSKWLSFGRVLFSPVHFEIKNAAEDRVLILDGLGKDWSYYVALTYPNATIYNLGTDPAETPSSRKSASGPFQSLPNYRHFHHPSLNSPFPFPKGFFAAVVFRFPTATSETAYRNAFFECKRVLRPGGYLEVSVLDIDMLNMGTRARSALRSLKMQMQAEEPNVSLKPMSDTIQRLLGRRGFENLNRCMVGVPAAGRIPGSRDESADGTEPTSASTESNISSNKGKQRADDKMPALTDLFTPQSAEGDENITKMVSRIGRWWYSRCYETIVQPNGEIGKSIWADDALVRECEKRGTSLRLMVCYAQKPDCPVRRTISV